MNIAFLGDIHEQYEVLNLAPPRAQLVIQLGDFGFLHQQPCTVTPLIETWFIDGNHDSIEMLHALEPTWFPDIKDKLQIGPNLFYIPRGSVHEIGNSIVGFLGGADSIDKATRTEGVDWFRDETIKICDLVKLEDELTCHKKLDVLVTHAVPSTTLKTIFRDSKEPSPSADMVEQAVKYFQPALLICGHIHVDRTDDSSYSHTIVEILDINQFKLFDL